MIFLNIINNNNYIRIKIVGFYNYSIIDKNIIFQVITMDEFKFTKDDNEVFVSGFLNEYCNFKGMLNSNHSETILDMAGVTRVNSLGVRAWVQYIINYTGKIIYRNCSVPVVEQFNMVPEFIGDHVDVDSFFAPFYCNGCDHEEDVLLNVKKNLDIKNLQLTIFIICPLCKEEMESDFTPDEYLFFLGDLVKQQEQEEEQSLFEAAAEDDYIELEEQPEEDNSVKPGLFRKPLSISSKVYFPDKEGEYKGTPNIIFIESINHDGIFLYIHKNLYLNDKLKVEFILSIMETNYPISCEVVVKWPREADYEKNIMAGVGTEFYKISTEHMKLINLFIESRS